MLVFLVVPGKPSPNLFQASVRDQIVSNLERAWEISGGDEDQLAGTMIQISQVVARQFNKQE